MNTSPEDINTTLQRLGYVRACIEAAQMLGAGDTANRLTDCAAQICEDLEQEIDRQLQSMDGGGAA